MSEGNLILKPETLMPVVHTRPDRLLRHDISDEELSMLVENDYGWLKDVAMVSIGGLMGALPGAISFLGQLRMGDGFSAVGTYEFASVLVACVCVALAVGMGTGAIKHSRRVRRLQDRIRSRIS